MRILHLLPGDQCAKRRVGNPHEYQEPGKLPARRPFIGIDDVLQPTLRLSKYLHISSGIYTRRAAIKLMEDAQYRLPVRAQHGHSQEHIDEGHPNHGQNPGAGAPITSEYYFTFPTHTLPA
jgi:hypothetical protein